jgi:hypothetical protein
VHYNLTNKGNKEFNNGAIINLASIIKHVMSSASEAGLVALYYGCKIAVPIQTSLDEMGHTQPMMPVTRSHRWHHDPKGFQINGLIIPLVEMLQCSMPVPILMAPWHP